MEETLAIQQDLYENIVKDYFNYKKSPKERITSEYVEARLESLNEKWLEFQGYHNQIVASISAEEKSSLAYFKRDTYNDAEEVYYMYKAELRATLKKLSPEMELSAIKMSHSVATKAPTTEVKLPRITIPTFSGNYTEWQSFHDLFVALTDRNDSLEDVQKLHYLKSNLSGEAEALLRQFVITGENYTKAWNILKKRYSYKRYIANCIFKKFFGQKQLHMESAQALKQLLDTSVECLNSLENLKLPVEHWDALIIYIIVSKLDSDSHKQWEETVANENCNELPNLEKLKSFLEMRFRTLEMIESSTKSGKPVKTNMFHTTTGNTEQCAFCNESHYISHCKQFAKQPVNVRYEFVQKNGLCFNCMIPNHSVYKCKQSTTCKICHRRHHSLLHPENKRTDLEKHRESELQKDQLEKESEVTAHFSRKEQPEKELRVKAHFSRKEQPGRNVLLATALVDVKSRTGHTHIIRVLIDQGSMASFVTERIVQSLGLRRIKINGVVSGIGEGKSSIIAKYMVEFKIQSRCDTTFTVPVKAFVLDSLTSYLPTQEIEPCNFIEIDPLQLADPTYSTPNRIDILLGADIYCKIIDIGIVKSPSGVIAQKTHLGWILSGEMNDLDTTNQQEIMSLHVTILDNDLLKKFWEIEELIPKKKIMTKDEELCEKIYKETTKRDETGRCIVNLPLKQTVEETVLKCGDTKELAVKRFKQLEKRFERDHQLKIEYCKVIKEYQELKHMCKTGDDHPLTIYLPHHAVVRDDKDTTKVRIVYDASARGYNEHALNDCMMVGPTLQPDLRSLITCWRKHKVCLIGDIVKMYRQVMVIPEHADLQRIVWRDSPDDEIETYRLQTVTFGTASAPYLAVKTLNQLACDESHRYPKAADIVTNSFYMDDLMTGGDNLHGAIEIYDEMNNLLKLGGFQMQKWSSNCEELMNFIQTERDVSTENFEIKLDQIIKILGLTWDRRDDMFKFTVHLPEIIYPITKRSVLSDVARLFDPFGWLAPVIVRAKILIQKLWLCGLDWDHELPAELLEEWLNYRSDLMSLADIRLDRWLNTSSNNYLVELHGFSDASISAYAAVVYLRVLDEHKNVHIRLVAAKSKVAPLKQISVPRLELCGAVLLAKLLNDIASLLNISKNNIFAWTDSTIVLSWLQSQPTRWQTFVANRVCEIIQLIDNDKWRHVRSSDNAADLASRGVNAAQLSEASIWWTGPSWLKNKDIEHDRLVIPQTSLEEKTNTKTYHAEVREVPIWEKFSSLTKLKRALAYCRRFKKGHKAEYLTSTEMNEILEKCIEYYQALAFKEEIAQLKRKDHVNKKSKLASLAPFLDENNLIRLGGRLQGAEIPYDAIHPIILPGKDHLTMLLVRHAHFKTLHGGPQRMMRFLRTRYWIFGLKIAVKQCVRSCVTCIKQRAATQHQIMGQLPPVRVNPGRAFLNSGVDYAGPVQIRMSKGRGYKSSKGYICLFVCMSTKAVHLEAVTDLTAQAFIAAFRRFVSRRGHCANLWSDNGKNFIGAAKELRHMFEKGKKNVSFEITETLANDGTNWQFIPPRSPNFGGVWEAGIKSAKLHLNKVIRSAILTYEEMSTLLAQIEACLNSRPLGEISKSDAIPLTPGHFLIGEPIINVPDISYVEKNINLLTRWQLIQRMTEQFWRKWQGDYLHTMQQRHKWQKVIPSPNIGDVVIIKEDDLPPTKWLMGRIEKLHPGPDQFVRVVTVKCKGESTLKRPLSKIIPLVSVQS